ncbi:MAG: hypothetical protein JST64_13580, partial [Actinobacteria bacterium]|nr:hypothetical protein [Actinomycetota bacterium]
TADPEGDRLRQEQRRLERRIREAKRRVAAAEPFGDPELGRAKARLQQRQADMRKFVADHDRKRFPEREKLRSAKSGSGVTPARAGSGPDVGSPSSGGSRHGPKVTGSELRSAPGTSRSARRPPGDLPKPASKAVKTFEDDHAKRVGTTALDAISKVHRIPPNLPKFTAVAEQLPRGDRAAFDPLRMTLALDPVDGDAFSFVHEFGHWLDWTALKAREWSSVKDARLGEFRDAVHASRRYQELATEMDRLDGRIRRRVASADDIADFKHIAYLLEPQELWSRAYSQWVTTESGAPALLAGLKAMQPGSGSRVPDQWADGDFGPIAVVIRKLFESRGLLP